MHKTDLLAAGQPYHQYQCGHQDKAAEVQKTAVAEVVDKLRDGTVGYCVPEQVLLLHPSCTKAVAGQLYPHGHLALCSVCKVDVGHAGYVSLFQPRGQSALCAQVCQSHTRIVLQHKGICQHKEIILPIMVLDKEFHRVGFLRPGRFPAILGDGGGIIARGEQGKNAQEDAEAAHGTDAAPVYALQTDAS